MDKGGKMNEIIHCMYQCAVGGHCGIFNDMWALWDIILKACGIATN